MSLPADNFNQVRELHNQGLSQCAIERYTGVPRAQVRRILGLDPGWSAPVKSNELSIRQRQYLLSWRVL